MAEEMLRCFCVRKLPPPEEGPITQPPPPEVSGELRTPSTSRFSRSSPLSPPATINLTSIEYERAVHSHSFKVIWTKIHQNPSSHSTDKPEEQQQQLGLDQGESRISPTHLMAEVLQPDRASVEEALQVTGKLIPLASDFFEKTEYATRLCFELHGSIYRARCLYASVDDLLRSAASPTADSEHEGLSQAQCEWAYDILQTFNGHENPFPSLGSSSERGSGEFDNIRLCFYELKQQIDRLLKKAEKKLRLIRHATTASAICLVVSAVGLAVAGIVIATHALVALAAAPPAFLTFLRCPGHLFEPRRKRLLQRIAQLDAATRGTYAMDNDLQTVKFLVLKLHDAVESDRFLVRLGLEQGSVDRHPIELVLQQLRKSHTDFVGQLKDLEEHLCLFVVTVNRARSFLLQHIHRYEHHYNK